MKEYRRQYKALNSKIKSVAFNDGIIRYTLESQTEKEIELYSKMAIKSKKIKEGDFSLKNIFKPSIISVISEPYNFNSKDRIWEFSDSKKMDIVSDSIRIIVNSETNEIEWINSTYPETNKEWRKKKWNNTVKKYVSKEKLNEYLIWFDQNEEEVEIGFIEQDIYGYYYGAIFIMFKIEELTVRLLFNPKNLKLISFSLDRK